MRVRRDPRGWPGRAALILLAFVVLSGTLVHGDGAALGFAFKEVAAAAGLTAVTVFGGKDANRYLLETTGTGVALFDYDGDGFLDVFLVNGTTLEGFPKGQEPINHLYRNRRDGTFEDVSDKAGITKASGTYGLGVSTLDFDDDGWVDAYVANDSNPSALYRNNHDGTFTDIAVTSGCAYSQDGKPQAGMGVAIGDYDHNGTMDIFKTNFAGDTSTLYSNSGKGFCDDRTFAAGIGVNTRWLGWATAFVDLGHDRWLELLLPNRHVYPEVAQLKTEAAYAQRKVVYMNRGNRPFADVTEQLGGPGTTPRARRSA